MKVKELIEELSKLDQALDVYHYHREYAVPVENIDINETWEYGVKTNEKIVTLS